MKNFFGLVLIFLFVSDRARISASDVNVSAEFQDDGSLPREYLKNIQIALRDPSIKEGSEGIYLPAKKELLLSGIIPKMVVSFNKLQPKAYVIDVFEGGLSLVARQIFFRQSIKIEQNSKVLDVKLNIPLSMKILEVKLESDIF